MQSSVPDNFTENQTTCPSCSSTDGFTFHTASNVPVNSVLNVRSYEAALAFPTGNIRLKFCTNCGFVWNSCFDPELTQYSTDCEESQGCSPTFNKFAENLASRLVDKYHLYNKQIVEIGCGKGEFLALLCELGENSGVGFDPAYVAGRADVVDHKGKITFIEDYYSEKYADYRGDLICCRMTLEHIPNTRSFLESVRNSIGTRSNTVVFFQVPDVTRILRDCSFEDIYYEHCSYFSPGSLARLFRNCGFDILDLRTEYDDQYLLVEAVPTSLSTITSKSDLENDLTQMKEYVAGFRNSYPDIVRAWRRRLSLMHEKADRAVVWGSGSKGVAFLTTLGISNEIEYVVDINPYRQGTYMAGTGQRVVAPDYLKTYQPDAVIIMNPVYRDEIQQDLDRMGLHPRILTLGSLDP